MTFDELIKLLPHLEDPLRGLTPLQQTAVVAVWAEARYEMAWEAVERLNEKHAAKSASD